MGLLTSGGTRLNKAVLSSWERRWRWWRSTSTLEFSWTTDRSGKSTLNTSTKKGQSRLYFLRKLRYFNVCSKMLHIFYKSVVESAISFAAICWGSGIRTRDLNRINKLIKKAGSVLGVALEPLELIIQRRMLQKLIKIMEDSSHPLHNTVKKQKSVFSERLVQVRCKTERYRRSFLPSAICLKNGTLNL